jgi:hypothetical protein
MGISKSKEGAKQLRYLTQCYINLGLTSRDDKKTRQLSTEGFSFP